MTERLDAWRTGVHNDIYLGIVAVVWTKAREESPVSEDVGLAAGWLS